MKHKILIVVTLCALLFSACGTQPAETPKPADTTAPQQPKATEALQATEAPKAVNTPLFTEVPKPTKSKPVLYLTSVKGQVEVRMKGTKDFTPGQVGQKLGEGTEVRTGADSIAVLYRDKTSMVIVDQKSEVQVKELAFKAGKPITLVSLKLGAAAIDHKGKLPDGAVLAIEAPDKSQNGVVHSTIRVSYDPETKVMTAVCTSGECNLVKGDQSLSLKQGEAVDVEGLAPLPNMPEEMSTDQANQFLAMADQLCGCQIDIGDIYDIDLESYAPPDDEVPTPEEDLENSADEEGNSIEDEDETPTDESGDSVDGENPPDDNGNGENPPDEGGESPDGGGESPDGGGEGGE